MAVDSIKGAYSSNWDIDRLYTSGEATVYVPVNGGAHLYSIPAELQAIGIPHIDGVYRIGGGRWQQFGGDFFLMNNQTHVWARAGWIDGTITVRYYVYIDKVNY